MKLRKHFSQISQTTQSQSSNSKNNWKKIIFRPFYLMVFFLLMPFQNCADKANFKSEGNMYASQEDGLLDILQEAKDLQAKLIAITLVRDYTDTSGPVTFKDTVFLKDRELILKDLIVKTDLITKMITTDKIPVNNAQVLKEVDILVNKVAKARDILVEFSSLQRDRILALDYKELIKKLKENLEAQIAEVRSCLRAEIAALDKKLTIYIDAEVKKLRDELVALSIHIDQVEESLKGQISQLIKNRIEPLEKRVDAVEKFAAQLRMDFESFRTSALAEDAVLKKMIQDLTKSVGEQIDSLKAGQAQLAADILALNKNITALQTKDATQAAELQKVKELQGKICPIDPNTHKEDKTSNPECISFKEIRCDVLFTSAVAQGQCQLLVKILVNNDQLLQAMDEMESQQNKSLEIIEKSLVEVKGSINILTSQVSNLTDITSGLTKSVNNLNDKVSGLTTKLNDIDKRLAIVEFKASKAEAIASIESRIQFNNSWITQRSKDIRDQFCGTRTLAAVNVYDYEAGIHNWAFCQEKLDLLHQAAVVNAIAASYGKILGSINVETSCNAVVKALGNKPVSALTKEEMIRKDVAQEVIANCTNGGQEVAWVAMYNLVKYLKTIGPDHRTYAFMGKMAKFPNILFLGAEWSKVSQSAREEFENTDPTSPELKDTFYGQIERLFPKRFVNNVYHSKGVFIEDPNQIKIPADLSIPFNRSEIANAQPMGSDNSACYMARVRDLEINCSDCGFTLANHQASKGGKARYSYPLDYRYSDEYCPIDDEVIIPNADGAHKAYRLFYTYSIDSGVIENLHPLLVYNQHLTLAHNTTDIREGNLPITAYYIHVPRAGLVQAQVQTRYVLDANRPWETVGPYGGVARPNCLRFAILPKLKYGDFSTPQTATYTNTNAASLYFLNGFTDSSVAEVCRGISYPTKVKSDGNVLESQIAGYSNFRDGSLLQPALRYSWLNPSDPTSASGLLVRQLSQTFDSARSFQTTQLGPKYFMYRDNPTSYAGTVLNSSQQSLFNPYGKGVSSTDFLRATQSSGPVMVQECSHCVHNLANLNPSCSPVTVSP